MLPARELRRSIADHHRETILADQGHGDDPAADFRNALEPLSAMAG